MKLIKNLSIRTRLLFLLLVPLILCAVVSFFLMNTNTKNIALLDQTLQGTALHASSLVLNADRDMYQALTAYQMLQQPDLKKQDAELALADYKKNVEQVLVGISQALDLMKNQHLEKLSHPQEQITIDQIMSTTLKSFNEWTQITDSNIKNNNLKGFEHVATFNKARQNVRLFGEIIEFYAENKVKELNNKNILIKKTLVVSISCVLLILSVIGIFLIRQINFTVQNVLYTTKQIAQGNLSLISAKSYTKDELGQITYSVDQMVIQVRTLVASILQQTQTVSTASEDLAVSAKESADASSHVAEIIQEVNSQAENQASVALATNRSMEEMATGVKRITGGTSIIADQSTLTSEQVDHGYVQMEQLKEQLNQISFAIKEVDQSVAELIKKSEQIGTITDNITSFAQQTNLLSLNASIEAARAGEHGKGFAVVAQEIRKLASNSLDSASVINDLISETRTEIKNTSCLMTTTTEQTEKGILAMKDVFHGFEKINMAIKQVAEQLHDTSAITQQMSASSEEVSQSMEQSAKASLDIAAKSQNVAAATEEQLALAENITLASKQLQFIVKELNTSVSFFKV